jgi:Tol biopolymer transport system component
MTPVKLFIPAVILCLLPLTITAQPEAAGAPEVLVSNSGYFFMNPRFSPDGSQIAFTSQQYSGLWVAGSDGRQASQLTGDAGAGYRFSWSPDSRYLLTGVSRESGPRREFSLKMFDAENGEERQLTPYAQGEPPLPVFYRQGSGILIREGNSLQSIDSGLQETEGGAVDDARPVAIPVRNGILISYDGDREQLIRPASGATDEASYLWSEVSPDGEMLAFKLYGGNLYISDLNGNILVDLGRGEAPSWSPDSRYLSFMITEDDGHDITGSDIYVADIAGSNASTVNITENSGLHAMHPAWSADGSRIAFGDMQSGSLYQVILNY